MPATKIVYVPTGEVRRPELNEYFQHRTFDHQRANGSDVVIAGNGAIVCRCYISSGCPDDSEIYEKVVINV